jgi:hypothetical protein
VTREFFVSTRIRNCFGILCQHMTTQLCSPVEARNSGIAVVREVCCVQVVERAGTRHAACRQMHLGQSTHVQQFALLCVVRQRALLLIHRVHLHVQVPCIGGMRNKTTQPSMREKTIRNPETVSGSEDETKLFLTVLETSWPSFPCRSPLFARACAALCAEPSCV